MLPIKFWIIWQSGFTEDFQKSTNQKQELPVVAMFVNGSGRNEQSSQRTADRCFLPSISSFGLTVKEENNFLNQPIRNKSRLWRPCLLMDQDEMTNLYRGPSIDASYQVSVHFAKRFQRRFLKISNICIRVIFLSTEIFQKSTNQKQALSVVAMFVHRSGQNENS